MPRGVRAIHGAEVTGDLHGHSDPTFTHTTCEPWLAVTCWCEAWVVQVEFDVFRELGLTYSCGDPDCKSPGGDTTVGLVLLARELYNAGSHQVSTRTYDGGERIRNADGESYVQDWQPMGRSRSTLSKQRQQIVRNTPRVLRLLQAGDRFDRAVDRVTRQDVRVRRDIVKAQYELGFGQTAIARKLDVPTHTVANDVQWLRAHGELGPPRPKRR